MISDFKKQYISDYWKTTQKQVDVIVNELTDKA